MSKDYDEKEMWSGKPVSSEFSIEEYESLDIRAIPERGISKAVCEFFDVRVEYNEEREIIAHRYPLHKEGKLCGYKRRLLPKTFTAYGDAKETDLFGQQKFPGPGKYIIITEGELDCLAVAEAMLQHYDTIYPVVSITLGAKAAKKQVLLNRDYLRRFEKVIFMLDNDEEGKLSTPKAAQIVGVDKAYIANLQDTKDACDYLKKYGPQKLCNVVFQATKWSPSGILMGKSLWDAYKNRKIQPARPYPDCFPLLNKLLEGKRSNEIVLLTSGTGSGKSTIMKEIILHDLNSIFMDGLDPPKYGIISLEEPAHKTVQSLIKMQLRKHPKDFTEEEEAIAYKTIFGDYDTADSEKVIVLNHQGSCSDESLIDKMESLCLYGCNLLVLDHITIAVSEGVEGLEGNAAIDKMMSDLLKLVQKYPVWIGVVSHLRKASFGSKSFEQGRMPKLDDIKGSGSIKQVSFDIIAAARDATSDDEFTKNLVKLRVIKARETGETGFAGFASYNHNTFRLSEVLMDDNGDD